MSNADLFFTIIVILIVLYNFYNHFKGNNKKTPEEIINKELTIKEKASITSIVMEFEKEAKRKITVKEMAFVTFAVKSWRLHYNPSYMSTLFFKEGQNIIDVDVTILDISILMQWEKEHPEDYAKYRQQ